MRAARRKGAPRCDLDMMKRYQRLSVDQKLEWLEETQKFLFSIAPSRTKRHWAEYRALQNA